MNSKHTYVTEAAVHQYLVNTWLLALLLFPLLLQGWAGEWSLLLTAAIFVIVLFGSLPALLLFYQLSNAIFRLQLRAVSTWLLLLLSGCAAISGAIALLYVLVLKALVFHNTAVNIITACAAVLAGCLLRLPFFIQLEKTRV